MLCIIIMIIKRQQNPYITFFEIRFSPHPAGGKLILNNVGNNVLENPEGTIGDYNDYKLTRTHPNWT